MHKFEENSQLESIEHKLFHETQIKKIVIPKNVNLIKTNAFSNCQKLKCIEFLGNKLTIFDSVFKNSTNLAIISFPNAHEVILYDFIKGINNLYSLVYFMSGTKVTFNY